MNEQRALGIDIGGTKIAVAAVDSRGRIHARVSLATEAELGFGRAVGRMLAAGDEVLGKVGWSRGELCGVGVGCAGPVSAERGVIDNPYTLPTWSNCDIVTPLRAALGKPAYLENDADAAALGEWFAGGARGASRVVMLTLGTGVGGGAVLDGKVYRGTRGEHPELGHMPIAQFSADVEKEPGCYCGTRGCLEAIASGTAVAEAGKTRGYADSRQVFAAFERGEAGAREIVSRVQRALEMATWTVLHTFMPEVIVLGGGMGDAQFELWRPALEACAARATMVPAGGVRIAQAELGNDAGLVGAASLAFGRDVER
jgi:glucokinase